MFVKYGNSNGSAFTTPWAASAVARRACRLASVPCRLFPRTSKEETAPWHWVHSVVFNAAPAVMARVWPPRFQFPEGPAAMWQPAQDGTAWGEKGKYVFPAYSYPPCACGP